MFKSLNRRAFRVGGAVRDAIMGITPHDIDWVIEKTSPEEYEKVFPDHARVGNSFPVYLHPELGEVALARTEKFLGFSLSPFVDIGAYQNFDVVAGVSIEEDLARRDFTINSIAQHYETGVIIDPYGGARDIDHRVLRCVNPTAFVEDPLRIYRGARFYAKYNLNVERETSKLIKDNIHNLSHVNPERVYAELKKVYESCSHPSNFFLFLKMMDGLKIHFKPLHCMTNVSAGPVKWHGDDTAFEHAMDSLDHAKEHNYSFDVALAALFHDTGKAITPKSILPHHYDHENRSHLINKRFVKQHRFTAKQEDMIVNFALVHMKFHHLEQMNPTRLVRFWKTIKRHADEYIQCADCDCPLNENQYKVLELIRRAFRETKIEVPKGCKDPASFVEQKHAQTLKTLLKEIRKDG